MLLNELVFIILLWNSLTCRLSTFCQPFLHYKSSFFTSLEVSTGRIWHLLNTVTCISTYHSYSALTVLLSMSAKNIFPTLSIRNNRRPIIVRIILLYHEIIYTMLSKCCMRPILQVLNWLGIHWLVYWVKIQLLLLLLSLLICISWCFSSISQNLFCLFVHLFFLIYLLGQLYLGLCKNFLWAFGSLCLILRYLLWSTTSWHWHSLKMTVKCRKCTLTLTIQICSCHMLWQNLLDLWSWILLLKELLKIFIVYFHLTFATLRTIY